MKERMPSIERMKTGREKYQVCQEVERVKKSLKVDVSRRRRVWKFGLIINLLLLLVLLIGWAMEPRCCDTYSNLSYSILLDSILFHLV